jgi:AraC family transcriptional regulator, transcriptional activator of pobA
VRELSYLLERRHVPTPVDAHHVSRPPRYAAQKPHRLDYFQALLLTEGEAEVAIDGNRFASQPGRIVLTAPGQVLALRLSPGARRHVLCFTSQAMESHIGEALAGKAIYTAGRSPLFIDLPPTECRRVEHCLEAMADELDGWDRHSQGIVDALLREALGRLDRAASGGGPATDHRTTPWASRFLRCLELHFRSTRRVDDYARWMAVSAGHLHTRVRDAFGCSPKSLIDQRVVREAQRLLRLTDLTVRQVASELGFDDSAYFCRFFRRLTGTTPATFRQSREES